MINEGLMGMAGETRRGAYAESPKMAAKMGSCLPNPLAVQKGSDVTRELDRLGAARVELVEAGQQLEARLRLVLDVQSLEKSREEAMGPRDAQLVPATRCDLALMLRSEAEQLEWFVAGVRRLTEHIAL